MRLIFGISIETSDNVKDGLVYHEGPVKRLTRSVAKAETDYACCSYPTTAKIVDLIRCCLVYKNPKDLLNGIDKFLHAIGDAPKMEQVPLCTKDACRKPLQEAKVDKSNKTIKCVKCWKKLTDNERTYYCAEDEVHICVKCGKDQLAKRQCLKRILRVKNMFLDNKQENGNEWDLYRYADIKMGVLMEYDGQSMIVEVQFLLQFMLKAKSLGHGLYEIERNKDFIFDVNKIMSIGATDDNIDNQLRNAVTKGDESALATLLLNEAPVDLSIRDASHNGLIHYAIDKYQKKVLKFMLDAVQTDGTAQDFESFINMKGEYGFAPIHKCKRKPEMLKLLLSYDEVDVNIKEDDCGETLLMMVVGQKNIKEAQSFELLMNDDRCEWNVTNNRNETLFIMACQNGSNIDFIKQLWARGYFDVNHVDDFGKGTALIYACYNTNNDRWKGFPQLVEFLLSIPNIDVNIADKRGYTAVDRAIEMQYTDMVMMLYNRKDLNWKSGTQNKLKLACEMARDVDMIELILKLWPEIDVNEVGPNDHGRSALFTACQNEHNVDILRYMLDVPGMDVDILNSKGYSPWLFTVNYGFRFIEQIKILFERKDIDFNRTVDGMNVVDLAKKRFDKELIAWLKSNVFHETK